MFDSATLLAKLGSSRLVLIRVTLSYPSSIKQLGLPSRTMVDAHTVACQTRVSEVFSPVKPSGMPLLLSDLHPAVAQVFNNVYLLEMILIEIPPKDLLINLQRTCRTFKHAIDMSPQTKRLLYLLPERNATYLNEGPCFAVYLAPLVHPADLTNMFDMFVRIGDITCAASGRVVRVNPFVEDIWLSRTQYRNREYWHSVQGGPSNQRFCDYPHKQASFEFDFDVDESTQVVSCSFAICLVLHLFAVCDGHSAHKARVDFPNASWRRMLLTSPPITSADCSSCKCSLKCALNNAKGITLGDIADYVKKHSNAHENCVPTWLSFANVRVTKRYP